MSCSSHRDVLRGKSFKTSKELVSYCKSIRDGVGRSITIARGARLLSDRDQCKLACNAAIKAAGTGSDEYHRLVPLISVIRTLNGAGLSKDANKLAKKTIEATGSIVPLHARAEVYEGLAGCCWDMDAQYRKTIMKSLFQMLRSKGRERTAQVIVHLTGSFDQSGESEFVDGLLKNCKNDWLIGRIERDRAKHQASKGN